MNALASGKTRLLLAIAGLVVAVITIVVLMTGRKPEPKPVKTSKPVPTSVKRSAPSEPPPLERVASSSPLPAIPLAPDGKASPVATAELLVLARRIEATDPQRARLLLLQVLAADPENRTALERLSKKMLTDEKPVSARQLLERCLRVQPRSAECEALNAQVPSQAPVQAHVDGARDCLARTPDATDCMYTLMDSALYAGSKEGAALYALSMHKVSPDAVSTKYAIGRVRAAYGSYGEARTYFEAACELGNKDACFRANLLRQEGF